MSRIRVKLDLSDFYDDKKRFAFVLIDPEWKNVKCLQRHVEKLFKLSSVEFVTVSHSCYLPPREDIGVVNSGDVLRVIPADSSNSVKNVLEPADTEVMPRKKKTLKECIETIPNNFEAKIENEKEDRKTRKRKYPITNLETCSFNANVITDATVSVKKLKNIFDQKSEECDSLVFNTWKEQNVKDRTKESIASNCISDENGEITTKHKRKRKRKKKTKKSEVVTEDSFNNPIITNKKCFKSTPIASAKSQGHIRFDDDGKAADNDEENNPEKTSIVFTSYLDNLCKSKARIIKGVVINNSSIQNGMDDHSEKEKCVETVQEHSLKTGTVLHNTEPTASINRADEKNHMEESPSQTTNGFPAVSKIQSETFSTKQILSLSEPLLGEPTIGDILIFKIYRLNECSEPSLSDFICGKFEDTEEATEMMKIFLIDGQDQLVDSEGKTFMNLDMRGPDYLFLKYEDLIDKKVFRM